MLPFHDPTIHEKTNSAYMLFYERKPRSQSLLPSSKASHSYSLVPLRHLLPPAAVAWPSLHALIASNEAPSGRRHRSSSSATSAAASSVDQVLLQRGAQHDAALPVRSLSSSMPMAENGDDGISAVADADMTAVNSGHRWVESLRAWVQADNVTLLRAVSLLNEEAIDLVEQLCSAVQPQILPLVDEQNANRVYVDSAMLVARFLFQVLIYIRCMQVLVTTSLRSLVHVLLSV